MQIFIYCKVTLHVSGVVNKYLHTVASGWIFINLNQVFATNDLFIWKRQMGHIGGCVA